MILLTNLVAVRPNMYYDDADFLDPEERIKNETVQKKHESDYILLVKRNNFLFDMCGSLAFGLKLCP